MSDPGETIKAIICDVDGCLCPETSERFDVESLGLLARALQSSKAKLTLCTGRPIPFAESMARLLGITLPIMAENGAWIWDPASNSHEMDPAITSEHLEAVHQLERWTRTELGPMGVTIQPGKHASVTLHHVDTDLLRGSVLDRVNETCERESWPFRVSMTWFYINCDLAHVSKATAIERFKARTGYTTGQLAGIGDTMSDSLIADKVGWFACPANAQDGLKQRADFVAPSQEVRGVIEILERLARA